MSAYDNVVVGKLKLKGKALRVKVGGGIKKKKKSKHDKNHASGGDTALITQIDEDVKETERNHDDYLTPAETRFLKQTEKFELQRLAKMANKSHRDRIQEFNQYLANLSEHYDIPKVGPG